ncbi:MAG TPA: SpvB/TcaC N-terminal domain-containing protein, partial [Bdellovibrionota bacterium]|nr:SpvB/TcaC N-terminal domain-containing protein [Bdellovibrionota bacterium]
MRHRHSTQFASFISLLLAFLIAFNFPLSRAVYAAGTQGANADASTGDQGDGASSPKAASGATQKAFQTNLFTGSTSYSIPIDVPSGKDGMQPQLGLTYSSEGGRSWVGYGWALGVGEIIRKGANGSVAQFNDTDEYAIQMQGV